MWLRSTPVAPAPRLAESTGVVAVIETPERGHERRRPVRVPDEMKDATA